MRGRIFDIADLRLCTEGYFSRVIFSMYQYVGLNTCVYCNRGVDTICEQCLSDCSYISPECYVCKGFSTNGNIHNHCKDVRGYYDIFISFCRYTKVQKTILNEVKYRDFSFQLFSAISIFLNVYFAKDPFNQLQNIVRNFNQIIILPTPTTPTKFKSRGFFPVKEISIILGRKLKSLNLEVKYLDGLLLRTKEIETQSHKDRMKRLLAINSAYEVDVEVLKKYYNELSAPNTLILIVDDVYTTGATSTILIEKLTEAIIKGGFKREDFNIGFFAYAVA